MGTKRVLQASKCDEALRPGSCPIMYLIPAKRKIFTLDDYSARLDLVVNDFAWWYNGTFRSLKTTYVTFEKYKINSLKDTNTSVNMLFCTKN